MRKKERPTLIPIEYPLFLEALKKELAKNPGTTLTAFCKKHAIDYGFFDRWLRTIGESFYKLRGEACTSPYTPNSQNTLYLNKLVLLKAELNENVHLRFSDFCKRHRVSHRGMACWLTSYNLDFADILAQICVAKGVEIPKSRSESYTPLPVAGEKETARFEKTLDEYRKELAVNSRYSLKVHCAKMGTGYYNMLHWMRNMRINTKALKKTANLKEKIPSRPGSGMVMVQFRPNGGTRSDMFKGVTISCSDGKIIYVEECSVIELCTFLYTYDKDQRRK